jgi:DNA-binding transcriptional LysR family regulator
MPRTNYWERVARRLKLRDLRVLLTVQECGSMAKAAQQLGVSQPAVSQTVSSMEQLLGLKLFDRVAHGVVPTLYGAELARGVSASTDSLAQSLRKIAYLQDPTVGEFKVGCPDTVSVLLMPLIERMHRQSPKIQAHVLDTVAPTLHLPAVLDRKIDLAIVRIAGPVENQTFHPDLKVEVLFNDVTAIIAGKSSKWARRRKLSFCDLEEASWILPPPETLNYQIVEASLSHEGCPPPLVNLVTFSFQLRVSMLANEDYVSVLPLSVLKMHGDWLPVKRLPVALRPHVWPTVLVTLKSRTLNPIASIFIDRLRERTRSLDVPATA